MFFANCVQKFRNIDITKDEGVATNLGVSHWILAQFEFQCNQILICIDFIQPENCVRRQSLFILSQFILYNVLPFISTAQPFVRFCRIFSNFNSSWAFEKGRWKIKGASLAQESWKAERSFASIHLSCDYCTVVASLQSLCWEKMSWKFTFCFTELLTWIRFFPECSPHQ